MSTIATQLNWGSSYLVEDFYRRFMRRDASEKHYVNISRIAHASAGGGVGIRVGEIGYDQPGLGSGARSRRGDRRRLLIALVLVAHQCPGVKFPRWPRLSP